MDASGSRQQAAAASKLQANNKYASLSLFLSLSLMPSRVHYRVQNELTRRLDLNYVHSLELRVQVGKLVRRPLRQMKYQ